MKHEPNIVVYMDDIAMSARKPKEITDIDPDKTMFIEPKLYASKMLSSIDKPFPGGKLCLYSSPLKKVNHPELAASSELARYCSMIGSSQWFISLGRFDIATDVVTMEKFCVAPRFGHLRHLKYTHDYFNKFPHTTIRVCTQVTNYHSDLRKIEHDLFYKVYGIRNEEVKEPNEAGGNSDTQDTKKGEYDYSPSPDSRPFLFHGINREFMDPGDVWQVLLFIHHPTSGPDKFAPSHRKTNKIKYNMMTQL
jgi:hypothetical protein